MKKPGIFSRKAIRLSLAIKVTAIIAICIAAVSTTVSFIIYNLGYQALKEEIGKNLIMLASNSVISLDSQKLAEVKAPENEGGPGYLEVQKVLQKALKASNGKLRYVYTLMKNGDEVQYCVDATPIEDKENHSATGQKFDISDYSYVEKAFNGQAISEPDATPDEVYGGQIQTGYAPILDDKGKVIGVLAVDMDVSVLAEKKQTMIRAGMIALMFALMLSIILGMLFAKYLTIPIMALTKGTHKVAEGDFDVLVKVNRTDEFGQLATSFNKMTDDLRISHETLKKYNLELEDKVSQRTAELSIINKEIKDILNNMSQAIFTVDRDLCFFGQHSKYAEDIFGNIDFEGKNLLDLIFCGSNKIEFRESLEQWILSIFDKNAENFSDHETMQPIRECDISTIDTNGNEIKKYIRFDFQPILEEHNSNKTDFTGKVMLIVQDITEKMALTLEMEKKEQEYKDNINQIVEVINADREIFEDFMSECKENLLQMEPKLIELRDNKDNMECINVVFRTMHTIKGNAKYFNLSRIVGAAHEIETVIGLVRKGEQTMTDDLLVELFKKLDYFNTLFNDLDALYEKMVTAKPAEGQTTEETAEKKQESEVIKVKVHELDKLSSLIHKADELLLNINADKQKLVEVGSVLKETNQTIYQIKKINFDRILSRLPRMVMDISKTAGKKIKLLTYSSDIEIDRYIFDRISDPMIHLIRNSIDHGVESPEVRTQAGKKEVGTIEIKTKLDETAFVIEIKDDGAGIDVDKVRTKAVKNGLLTPQKAMAMSEKELMELIFLPGFSTKDQATDLSGRGVGMDVVKSSIEKDLRGSIYTESSKGQGTKFTLVIPLEQNQVTISTEQMAIV